MENKNLSDKESLELITEMINTAKGNIQNSYIFFLIWGWLVMIASLLNYGLLKFTSLENPEIAWSILIIGVFLSVWHGYKSGKSSQVKTYSDRIYGQIWFTFLISYFILLFFMENINYNINPLIMILVGGSTYLSGITIKFRPLIYGGIVLWISAIISFMLPGDLQLLTLTGGILIGYLVPGYILKYKNGKNV